MGVAVSSAGVLVAPEARRGRAVRYGHLGRACLWWLPLAAHAAARQARPVLHWIDNSSAVAAAVKGDSYAADSARIVHGLHASLLALGVRAWFEYVRIDANVSDKPSREDLSTACYALGEVMMSWGSR